MYIVFVFCWSSFGSAPAPQTSPPPPLIHLSIKMEVYADPCRKFILNSCGILLPGDTIMFYSEFDPILMFQNNKLVQLQCRRGRNLRGQISQNCYLYLKFIFKCSYVVLVRVFTT